MVLEAGLGTAVGLLTIGAGLAIGLAAGLSAIGQGMAAAAAVGGVAEKDYSFGKMITLVAMPETQAIYGFVIAILIIFVLAMGSGFFQA